MAEIYKAKTADPAGIQRLVVIKRILPHISSQPEFVDMLIDEAKIAVHFNHGNIAQIYDLGKVGDDYFIVMEYVDGKNLAEIVREMRTRGKAIPLEIIVYAILEMCRGLDYVHRKTNERGEPLGVIHRDVSPQNIILSYSGTVKVLDFGVAKAAVKVGHTESGVLKGKFAYMSPEQVNGERIDRRSDIFSAGILLWELLTQQRLFKRGSNPETIRAVSKAGFTKPSRIRKEVPKELDKIVAKALRKWRRWRYQYASEMADDLSQFLFSHYPEFRPIQVAQFLYRYFGSEPDEAGLMPELPGLPAAPEPRPVKTAVPPKEDKKISPTEATPVETSSAKRDPALIWQERLRLLAWGAGISVAVLFTIWLFIHFYFSGTFRLEVLPPEAHVRVDGKLLKNAPHYELAHSSRRPLELEVEAAGYQSLRSVIPIARGKIFEKKVVLAKALSPYGDLALISDPPGAKIYLDNQELKMRTPAVITKLGQGKSYKIGLYLEGYRFVEKEVQIRSGEKVEVTVPLPPETGSLEILSSPPGANVIVNSIAIGATPQTVKGIVTGVETVVEVTLPGYETRRQSFKMKPGEKRQLQFELAPLSP